MVVGLRVFDLEQPIERIVLVRDVPVEARRGEVLGPRHLVTLPGAASGAKPPRWVMPLRLPSADLVSVDDNVRTLRPPWVDELLDDRYLLDTLMEHIPDQIYFKDAKSRFVRVSGALASRLGLEDAADAVGKTDFDFFAGEHAQKAFADEQRLLETGEPLVGIEERETWQDGREAWVSTTKVPLRDRSGRIVGLFGISRDVTDKKLSELRLVEQAAQLAEQARALEELTLLDELTGLNSRRGLQAVGEQALYSARRAGTPVALLFIDVDGLKQINDTFGHAAGDDALRTIARVIRQSIRDGDVAARIGGDEFCVLLLNTGGEAVDRVRERITAGTQTVSGERALPFTLSATIGACEVDARTPGSLAQLLERADSLMYEQKTRVRSELFASEQPGRLQAG
jgi:diguanylate cyclase (GGDEF)-like protein/PAS domain S-box-containing protein